jgi:hypothetical protein
MGERNNYSLFYVGYSLEFGKEIITTDSECWNGKKNFLFIRA